MPLGASAEAGAADERGMTRVSGFRVSLPQFEGPLDLLLALITRRSLDVTELALADVTDEFIAHMRADWDLGRASEFLVVASTLLALKAPRGPRHPVRPAPAIPRLQAGRPVAV